MWIKWYSSDYRDISHASFDLLDELCVCMCVCMCVCALRRITDNKTDKEDVTG